MEKKSTCTNEWKNFRENPKDCVFVFPHKDYGFEKTQHPLTTEGTSSSPPSSCVWFPPRGNRAMKLVPANRPLTKRQRLMQEFTQWDDSGRCTAVTPRMLAGQYAVRYQQKFHIMPISPIDNDIDAFDGLLSMLDTNRSLAPYCVDVLFAMKNFTINSQSFANPNVIDKWGVIEKAVKLQKRDGMSGEQSEFSGSKRSYGVTRV